ncbi:MAG: tRNA (adenosine(37)-N6)-threonylcarbamoyltransferase complex dimerization subunit type 1 TsaB [Lysobacteraceae bacterium]|nr:tRNA (adenosine(37)-N6)-threonylcarbamoyltransferase complex dimerization subunit type 1 TsaB [Xanthomonadales bacterium]HPF74293.1 tRNA (adenosine(37)-N6)-threonylcarbamoyltransferase complex dimerization subunit type 1 TsaB [Xanthomonadaceae bacterium]HRY00638.1 tRNA (adenosine(37)-N6)-threonylcarbamoyltransferase complex dimerization subunit type 1 TsaB [Xanthomonadaceae bacterium]
MTTLLAIETSTEACSVAIWRDGEVLERFEIAPRQHAMLLLPWCEDMLAEAGVAKSQLDAIAVGRGPGAFTGVRLAIAAAQGMALGLDRPLLPVSTLAALALGPSLEHTLAEGQKIMAAIDARMGEVYAACYESRANDELIALGDETLAAPDVLALPAAEGWIGVGTGFAASDGELRQRMGSQLIECREAALPRAAAVARLGARDFAAGLAVAPERVEPAYLRNKVALTLVEQQAARAAKDVAR